MTDREAYIQKCYEDMRDLYQELSSLVGDTSDYAKRIRPAIKQEISALETEIEVTTAGTVATSIIKIF